MDASLLNPKGFIIGFALVATYFILSALWKNYNKQEKFYKRLVTRLNKGKVTINDVNHFTQRLHRHRFSLLQSFPFTKENEHAKIILYSYTHPNIRGMLILKANNNKLLFSLSLDGALTVEIDNQSKTYDNFSFLKLSYASYIFDALLEIDGKIREHERKQAEDKKALEAKFENFDKEAESIRVSFKKAEERNKAFSIIKDDPEAMEILNQMIAESEKLKKVRVKELSKL